MFRYPSYKPPKGGYKKLAEGNKVSHPKFGVGIIEEKLGNRILRVTFEDCVTFDVHSDFLTLI
jgi:hypothetical protein